MYTDHTILFFGQLIEVTGIAALTVKELKDTDELDALLIERYPQLKQYTFLKAINNKVVTESVSIPTGAVIALLPPFSGG
jgi:molybdopterin synthase sulfur carrier subunit